MATAQQPCCLIAEDDAIIGLALEGDLEEVGLAVAGPFVSVADALSWVEHNTPEIAILDFKLKDDLCTDLARTLLGRGVPVIFCSGYLRGPDLAPELGGVTWLEKPVERSKLLEAMAHVAPSLAYRLPRLIPQAASLGLRMR